MKPVVRLPAHHGGVTSVAFSPCQQFVASGGGDACVLLWDLTSHQQVECYADHDGPVTALTFSSDGKFILSASKDGTIRVRRLKDAGKQMRLKGHVGAVNAVIARRGGRIISGGDDGTVRFWWLETGEEESCLEVEWSVWEMCVTPDSLMVLDRLGFKKTETGPAEPAKISFLDLKGRGFFHDFDCPGCLCVASSSTELAWAGSDGEIEFGSAETGVVFASDRRSRQPYERAIWTYDFSDSPARQMGFEGDWFLDWRNAHGDDIWSLAFSPSDHALASASADGSIALWSKCDTRISLDSADSLHGHSGGVRQVAWSPDGRMLASASDDGSLMLWQTDF